MTSSLKKGPLVERKPVRVSVVTLIKDYTVKHFLNESKSFLCGRQSTALKISLKISNLWGRLKRTLIAQFEERFLDPQSRQNVSTISVEGA